MKKFHSFQISILSNINPFMKYCVGRKVIVKFLLFKFVSAFRENEKRRINIMVPIIFDYSFPIEKY